MISTGAFVIETLPAYSMDPDKNPEHYEYYVMQWTTIEIVCVLSFSVDMLLRFIGCAGGGTADMMGFLKDQYNWIDAMAILPFYARLAFQAVGETVILLHPPLPLAGVSIRMERGRQQNDSLADG